MSTDKTSVDRLLEQYGCGPVQFAGSDDGLYERHLLFDNVVALTAAGARERFEAVARSVRDVLSQRWIRTEETYERQNAKRIYYLSMEFLIGRSLANNVTNLLLDPAVRDLAARKQVDWLGLLEQEADAGLGNRPVRRYGGKTVNPLRLWAAATPDYFDFQAFSHGEFVGARAEHLAAESLTRVLYPDDSTSMGQGLRFVQEYFLVACSLADLVRRFRRANPDWSALPEKVAIQLNDTHPALAVPELMRIVLAEARLGWDEAWDLTPRTLAYTNHTLLPEALEKWPRAWFEVLLPRHLEIVREINRRLLDDVQARFPGDGGRVARVSLMEEGTEQKVRMANLAIVGSHSTNGVAAIHSRLLRTVTVRDLAEQFPARFNNKTNGVTPRRWLLLANPVLARAITAAIGESWITELGQLRRLAPLADDRGFRDAVRKAKREAKTQFAGWLRSATGQAVDPETIFDCQVKRIHEYKRQLLNALRVIVLYQRLRENPTLAMTPRTFFFAGKAAPAYRLAKVIIKLVN